VVGVDDFALRRGHVYANVLVDATTGRATDVLPGREAGPLEDWLKAHPGARVICRDRVGAYTKVPATEPPAPYRSLTAGTCGITSPSTPPGP
jgi:transposase